MEVRGLIEETVVRRVAYGGRSLREYRLAQAHPGIPPDRVLEQTLQEGFTEAARAIGTIFDREDPYGLVLPDPRSLRQLLRVFGEDIIERDWRADDILGWIYQYYQDEAREAFRTGRGRGQRRTADADELAAINCLYTPHWVVRALVDNTLGRLLLEQQEGFDEAANRSWSKEELRESSGETVAEFCRYIVPLAQPGEPRAPKALREIRVLDPACGSGHFLIYAFDILWRAYREAEPAVRPEDHAAAILERNLFGIDIDLRACQLAALGLYLKAKECASDFNPRVLNIVCADVRILDGERRGTFLRLMEDDPALRSVAERVLEDMGATAEIGSLLRVREPFERVFRTRREPFERQVRARPQREAEQVRVVDLEHRQLRLEGVIPRERTIGEILDALRHFERKAMERSDMGGQLFAADAERSLGLLSLLSQRYDVVLMNPPYNKRQELPVTTRDYLSSQFERTNSNIYAAFIEQAVDLSEFGGFIGMLTPMAYMYLEKLQALRTGILATEAPPELVLEFGWDILDPAQIQTAGTVLQKASGWKRPRTFWDLTAPKGSLGKEEAFIRGLTALRRGQAVPERYIVSLTELARVPGSPYAYWAPEGLRRAFSLFPPLDRDNAGNPRAEKIADVKQGLATADDSRFTRRWWEVPAKQIGPGRQWVPFVKGEEYARWYHDPSLVVDWRDNGDCYRVEVNPETGRPKSNIWMLRSALHLFLREGLTWQLVNANRRVRTRYLPPGCIFAHMEPSVFLANTNREGGFALLGLLNSLLANLAMLMLTPERRWEVGQISRLPISDRVIRNSKLTESAEEIHDLYAAWDTGNEVSSRFVRPRLLQVVFPVPERPGTGHVLADDFRWPAWNSWHEIVSLTGSPEMSLRDLLAILARRRDRFQARIAQLERLVDREVFRCYGLEDEIPIILETLERRLGVSVEDEDQSNEGEKKSGELGTSDDDRDEVERLLSYYAKQAMEASPQPLASLDPRAPGNLIAKVRDLLRVDWGAARSAHLAEETHELLGCSLDEWLIYQYFPFHVRLYRKRPVFWLLWSASRRGRSRRAPAFACFLDYRRLNVDTLRLVRGRLLAHTLDEARAEAERMERETTEARIAGAANAAYLGRAAEDARARVNEIEVFDRALANLLERSGTEGLDGDVPWLERMVATIRHSGYAPAPDLGVLANITPLREVGILHPDADRVR
jgi:SAM-dependent methyltransferase